MASTSEDAETPSSKPGLEDVEGEFWYAGVISERRAEEVLASQDVAGGFLVRDSLLPDADYVLSVNSGEEIWHYDVKYLSKNECVFNKYTFPGVAKIIHFYTENRLGKVYLEKPEEPIVPDSKTAHSISVPLIKLAPKLAKPLKPRVSPLSRLEADGEEPVPPSPQEQQVTSTGGESEISNSANGLVPAITTPSNDEIRSTIEGPCNGEPSERKNEEIQKFSQGDLKFDHSSLNQTAPSPSPNLRPSPTSEEVSSTSRSPATIIRQNSRAKMLVELKRLPSIHDKRVVIARKIRGKDIDEDSSSEEEGETTQPLPPPIPKRTTPSIKPKETHADGAQMPPSPRSPRPSPRTNRKLSPSPQHATSSPQLPPKPASPQLPQVGQTEVSNRTLSPSQRHVTSTPQLPPKPRSPKLPPKGQMADTEQTRKLSPSQQHAKSTPQLLPKPQIESSPQLPPKGLTTDTGQTFAPSAVSSELPGKSDIQGDSSAEPEEPMPAPPPMSTHPALLAKQTDIPKEDTSVPVTDSHTALQPGADVDTPQNDTISGATPTSPTDTPTSFKPMPKPRKLSVKVKPKKPTDERKSNSPVLTSPAEDGPQSLPAYLPSSDNTNPYPESLDPSSPSVSNSDNDPATPSSDDIPPGVTTEPATVPISGSPALIVTPTTSPMDAHPSTTSRSASQPNSTQHSFFFPTAAAATNGNTDHDWGSGTLSVSSPIQVEAIMKCGPMNTKRGSGGTLKKKRSFLRRK